MWTPTHILVTVCKARNLLEKGKGGNDAYCMICMGKEKFLTSVRQKTLSPVWDEQAEFMLTERADFKIKVYHKSSIMDEFVGWVVISVADLFNENNKSFVKWYKLQSREENSKKAAKERGEVEIRVEFITKPKIGSVMDLSSLSKTNKEKTLSLKNLKDKPHTFKHSFIENFKLLGKSKSKSKINEDNQLGEQAKRMNGSRLDFLDGEDMNSLSSSYSSLNGHYSEITCGLCEGRYKVDDYSVHLLDCQKKTCENCGEEIKKMEETQHQLTCRPAVVAIFSCPRCKTGLTEDEYAQHVVECMVPREKCRLCKGVIGHNHKCMACPVCTIISNVEDWLIFSNCGHMLCGDDECYRNYIEHFSTREGRLVCHTCRTENRTLMKIRMP